MGGESPTAVLYDFQGNELALQNGVAIPTSTPLLMIGGSDGTNSRYITLDTSGRQVIVGIGTAGTPVGGVVTIQGISGGTVVPISGTVTANAGTGNFAVVQATAANLNATVVASGNFNNASVSATAAAPPASATYMGGSVTTASPTYTTGQMDPLSLTTAGALRIDGSAVTQPVSGTVTANAGTGTFTVAGTVTANQGTANTLANAWSTKITDATNGPAAVKPASTAAIATDPALVVAISPNNSLSLSTQDVTATGALGALNAAVTVTHPGLGSVGFQLAAGTLIGTLVTEVSFDGGATWNATFFDNPTTDNKVASIVFGTSNTATAMTIVGVGGAGQTRVRVSAYTSGTANATVRASDINDPSLLAGGQAGAALPPAILQTGGSVTTAAPTYTTSTFNALSLTTAGSLRVASISESATGAAGPASATYVAGAVTTAAPTYTTGQIDPLSLTIGGLLRIDGVYPINATTPTSDIAFVGAAVTTAAPTYTTGQLSALSLTVAGLLRIDGVYPLATATPTTDVTFVGGAVTTAAPTYTTGQLDPLSLDTLGNLRVLATQAPVAGAALADAWSMKITDATNGPAAVKAASTAAVATDPALVVAVSPNNTLPTQVADVTATGALGALNASVQITLAGHTSIGFQLAAGTLIGTIVAEMSFDGGTTWNTTYFDETAGNKVSSVVFSSANTALGSTMIGVGGAGLARVRVSAYTSGTANVTIRASVLDDPSELYAGISGSTILPPTSVQMAGVYNSTTLQTIAVDTLGRIITSPASALASEAGFANGFVNLTSNTKNFVGSTAYNEQAAGAQRSVSSTSAADTAAGTGAQQVTITWFTSAGAGPNTETVTLNGTTAVNTVSTTMCFIESIVVTRVGSGASNAGTITLFTTTAGGGTAIGTIAIGTNQTFWCHHYVPTGTTCYITGIVAGANNNAGASFITSARSIGVAGAVELQISDFVRNGGGGNASQPSFERSYGTPLNIIGPARINGYVTPDGATTSTYWLSFDFYQQI